MPKHTDKILLISEESERGRSIRQAVETLRPVEEAQSGAVALQLMMLESYALIILDWDLSLISGGKTLRRIRKIDPAVPVIVIPREKHFVGDLTDALEYGAQRYGMAEDPGGIRNNAIQLLEWGHWPEQVSRARFSLSEDPKLHNLIGSAESLYHLCHRVEKIRNSPVSVMLSGESGTGKELVARLIHKISRRAKKPFIALNCAAIPENLLESELFGYERGAFTGAVSRKKGKIELADNGTLFLDEIGDMSPALQAKLLRVLEYGEFERLGGEQALRTDVRIISATNRDLGRAVDTGEFREDLYYRLNVFTAPLPPLRERPADIIPLAVYFAGKFNRKNGRDIQAFDQKVIRRLRSYHWPGNIREMQNRMEQAVLLADGDTIRPEHLSDLPDNPKVPLELPGRHLMRLFGETEMIYPLETVEEAAIRKAIRLADGNITRAAGGLGVSRVTLYRRLEKYGIDVN